MFVFVFSDEDLYRGAEELSASQDTAAGILPPCLSNYGRQLNNAQCSIRHRSTLFVPGGNLKI